MGSVIYVAEDEEGRRDFFQAKRTPKTGDTPSPTPLTPTGVTIHPRLILSCGAVACKGEGGQVCSYLFSAKLQYFCALFLKPGGVPTDLGEHSSKGSVARCPSCLHAEMISSPTHTA